MYKMYFVIDKELMEIPIPPEKMDIKINGRNETIDVLTLGEVNILKSPGLTDIEFTMMLPNQQYYFSNTDYKPPKYYLDILEDLVLEEKPFRFIVNRTISYPDSFDTNMMVSLENYNIPEEGGTPGEFMVDIKLKQHKDYGTQIVTIKEVEDAKGDKKAVAELKEERPSKPKPTSYQVKKGDTLWSIAKKQLDDETLHKEIQSLNNIKDPRKLKVGQVLKLPVKGGG